MPADGDPTKNAPCDKNCEVVRERVAQRITAKINAATISNRLRPNLSLNPPATNAPARQPMSAATVRPANLRFGGQ